MNYTVSCRLLYNTSHDDSFLNSVALGFDEAVEYFDKMVTLLNSLEVSFIVKEDWREGKLFDVFLEIFPNEKTPPSLLELFMQENEDVRH